MPCAPAPPLGCGRHAPPAAAAWRRPAAGQQPPRNKASLPTGCVSVWPLWPYCLLLFRHQRGTKRTYAPAMPRVPTYVHVWCALTCLLWDTARSCTVPPAAGWCCRVLPCCHHAVMQTQCHRNRAFPAAAAPAHAPCPWPWHLPPPPAEPPPPAQSRPCWPRAGR